MIRGLIDIGTNTAHLLIANVEQEHIQEIIFKRRHYTFLGEGGLVTIKEEGISRLMEALNDFKVHIEQNDCSRICVVATDALRSATNGPALETTIRTQFGWPIHIIDGMEEAHLIKSGVLEAVGPPDSEHLIMDIGGGSVEFIGVQGKDTWYMGSFPIGISRLYERFHLTEPMAVSSINELNEYLDEILQPLWTTIQEKEIHPVLIGCAGTFEIFLSKRSSGQEHKKQEQIPVSRMTELLIEVQDHDLEKRTLVPHLPKERAKYIVVALLLMAYTLHKLNRDFFVVSRYALKEGVIITSKYF